MTATQVDALVGVVPSKHQGIIAPQHARRPMGSTALFSSPYDEMGEYEERQSLGRRRVRPRKPTSVDAQKLEKEREEAKVRREEALKDPTLLTKHTFGERKDLHPSTRRALTETMGLREMTQVQAKTYVPILEGHSVVAKARTGTGKTLAFLLPALERLLAGDKDLYIPGQGIGMVIVAPTRELVIQIADEANRVLTYHAKDYSVCSIYGGTKFARDMGLFQKRLPTILVATPGRLRDHIADTRVKGKRFSDILASTGIVVLDEMDSLLDLGFKREITKILSYLPRPEKRQTLLFSATVPRSMKEVMKSIINPSYQFVNCVSDQDAAAQTNERVQQSFIRLANVGDYLPALATIVRQSMDRDENFKILVFFPTAKLVTFCTEFLQTFLDGSVYKLHSRMSQSARQRTSTTFRESSKAILCTSDVSARGVDYPDVTTVVQFGSPDSEELYIHRLGRTARAGKEGHGIQVLLPFEDAVTSTLHRNKVESDTELLKLVRSAPADVLQCVENVRKRTGNEDMSIVGLAEGASRSFLAYYLNRCKGLKITDETVVAAATEFALSTGLPSLPSFDEKTAKKIGIMNLRGVEVV